MKRGRGVDEDQVPAKHRKRAKRVIVDPSDVKLFQSIRRGVSTEVLVHVIQFCLYPTVRITCEQQMNRRNLESFVISKCYYRLKSDLYRRHFMLTGRFLLRFDLTSKHRQMTLPSLPIRSELLVIDLRGCSLTDPNKELLAEILSEQIPRKYSKSENYLQNVEMYDAYEDSFIHLLQGSHKSLASIELANARTLPFYHERLTKYLSTVSTWCHTNSEYFSILFKSFPKLRTYDGPQISCDNWSSTIQHCDNLQTFRMNGIVNTDFLAYLFHVQTLQRVVLSSKISMPIPELGIVCLRSLIIKSDCPRAGDLLLMPINKLCIKDCCICTLRELEKLRNNRTIANLSISFQDSTSNVNRIESVAEIFDSCPNLTQLELNIKHAMKYEFYIALQHCVHVTDLTISIFYLNHLDGLMRNCNFTHVYIKCYISSVPVEKILQKCEQIFSTCKKLERIDFEQLDSKTSRWTACQYEVGSIQVNFYPSSKI